MPRPCNLACRRGRSRCSISSAWTRSWPSRASWRRANPDRVQTSPLLIEMVRLGRLGQKSGAGFRKHDRHAPRPTPDPGFEPILHRFQHESQAASHSSDQRELTDRLFLPMLLEAMRAVDDGIVSEPADVDTGVTLGLGFPAIRGGLFGWYASQGAQNGDGSSVALSESRPRVSPVPIACSRPE